MCIQDDSNLDSFRWSNRCCGLVSRVSSYKSRGPGSIPIATTFSEKYWVCNGVHSASWVQWRSGSGLENEEYGRRDPSRWARGTLYPQKLVLNLPTSGGRSVGIVRSRTQITMFLDGFQLSVAEEFLLHF
jgi:hypothetical protein